MTPFLGFTPDLDPITPGAITSCAQLVPTLKGMAGAPSALDADLPALAAACIGAATITRLDNQRRVFAGTRTKLYELTGSTWADATRYGPSTETLAPSIYADKTALDVVSCTRSTTATYFNSSGVLTTAAGDTARYDYDPATLEYRGLLVEAAGTNLATYSQDFSNAAWTKTGLTIGASTAAPDGTATANRLVESVASAQRRISRNVTVPSGTMFTWSIHVSPDANRSGNTLYLSSGSDGVIIDFDLQSKTAVTALVGAGVLLASGIIQLASGYARLYVTVQFPTAVTTVSVNHYYSDDPTNGNATYVGDGVSGVSIWGAQIESGPLSSYVPTTAATATRAADNIVAKVRLYATGADDSWRFSQFGNVALAATAGEKIQQSAAGAFSDIAQAPSARIIETASGFVLAFATNDSTNGDRPDGWSCSGIYDYLTWTPGPGNQAANGRLLDTPGEVRAARRLGSNVVVYKESSMYLGQYVGPPVVWAFPLIASDVGAVSQGCVVDTGTAHLFISRDDFWIFDGSIPRPIGAPVREWFFRNSDAVYRYRIRGYYDRFTGRVWWFFAPNGSNGNLTEALVYHTKSNKWGHAQVAVETILDYTPPDTTFDSWPPGPATSFDDIIDLPFDSPAFDTEQPALAVFSSDHKLKTLAGPCEAATLSTGDVGSEGQISDLVCVRPRFLTRPGAASMTNFTKKYSGDLPSVGETSALNGSKFDVLASARYHAFQLSMEGDFEIVAIEPELRPGGEE